MKKGFALLEIVIVVAILALLGGGGWYVTKLRSNQSMIETGIDAKQNATQAVQQINQQTGQEQNTLDQIVGNSSTPSSSDLASYRSKILGLAFSYPAYFGQITETTSSGGKANRDNDTISFSYNTTGQFTDLNFMPVNNTTNNIWEGEPNMYAFTGATDEPTSGACSHKAYLDAENYNITLKDCVLKTLPSGIAVVTFSGIYTTTSTYDSFSIGPCNFEGALLNTKSDEWPGMVIYADSCDSGTNFDKSNLFFAKVANSFKYIQ